MFASLNHIGGIWHIGGNHQYIELEYNADRLSLRSAAVLPVACEYIPRQRFRRVMLFHYAQTLERVYILPLDS